MPERTPGTASCWSFDAFILLPAIFFIAQTRASCPGRPLSNRAEYLGKSLWQDTFLTLTTEASAKRWLLWNQEVTVSSQQSSAQKLRCWFMKTNKSIRVTSATLDATGHYLKRHLTYFADAFHFTLGEFTSPNQQIRLRLSWSVLEVSWSICQEAERGWPPFGHTSITALLTCLAPIQHHSKHLPFVCLKLFQIPFNSTAQRNFVRLIFTTTRKSFIPKVAVRSSYRGFQSDNQIKPPHAKRCWGCDGETCWTHR